MKHIEKKTPLKENEKIKWIIPIVIIFNKMPIISTISFEILKVFGRN